MRASPSPCATASSSPSTSTARSRPAAIRRCCRVSPYSKDIQQKPPHWSHAIESGATGFYVPKGYVHVIAQARGAGLSQGQWNFLDENEQHDGYDLVEWIAAQPWCDGNVGHDRRLLLELEPVSHRRATAAASQMHLPVRRHHRHLPRPLLPGRRLSSRLSERMDPLPHRHDGVAGRRRGQARADEPDLRARAPAL